MNTLCEKGPLAVAPLVSSLPSSPWSLLRCHRRGLLLTYGLFTVENVLVLLQPWLLGIAVQGLIQGDGWPTVAFLAEIVVSTVVSRCRRCFDARFFSRIYGSLAGRWAVEQRTKGRELTQVAARAVLARQLVDFLERDLPIVVHVAFQLVGAAVLLLLNGPWVLLGCALVTSVMLLQSPRFARQSQAWNQRLHDQLEKEVDVLERAEPQTVADHYTRLAQCQVGLADLQARQFGLAQGLTVVLMGFALWLHARTTVELSQLIAMVGYLQMFSAGLINMSPWLQQCLRLRDVVRRLREEVLVSSPTAGDR